MGPLHPQGVEHHGCSGQAGDTNGCHQRVVLVFGGLRQCGRNGHGSGNSANASGPAREQAELCPQPQQSCHQQAAANGQQDSRNQCGHARDAQRGDICKGDACAQKGYANAHQPFCGKLDAIRAFGMFRQEIQGNPQEQGKKEFGPSIAFRYEGGGKCHRDSYQYPGQQGLDTRERIRKGTFHGLSWVVATWFCRRIGDGMRNKRGGFMHGLAWEYAGHFLMISAVLTRVSSGIP